MFLRVWVLGCSALARLDPGLMSGITPGSRNPVFAVEPQLVQVSQPDFRHLCSSPPAVTGLVFGMNASAERLFWDVDRSGMDP